jgi:O-methyltransferase
MLYKLEALLQNSLDKARIRLSSSFNHIPVVFSRIFNELETESSLWVSRGKNAASLSGKRNYIEFGVWNGFSMHQARRSISLVLGESTAREWHFYGFDSFEGLPTSNLHADKHSYADDSSFISNGISQVYRYLYKHGFQRQQVTLTPGYFENVLTSELRSSLPFQHVSFVNFDVDYYSSTIIALDWVKPLMYNGTICFFDDVAFYKGNPHKGQLKAISEFNARNTQCGLALALDLDSSGRTFRYWEDL